MDAHRFDPTILREYDIRGRVDETLGEADAHALGRAFGSLARRQGVERLAVGRDGRLSSPRLEAALAEGLASTGLTVVKVGLGPSPMLYFACHTLDVGGGIMVTGSHNPPDYNGFKMVLGRKPFFGPAIQELGRLAAAGNFEAGAGSIEDVRIFDAYVDRLVQDFRPGLEVAAAWDAGNGAAGEVTAALTAHLPGRHVTLNTEVDGTFPNHHPDPTVPENLRQLRDAVLKQGCELGIAFDGDGDRIGLLDGKGRILWGDMIMLFLARDLLRERPGAQIIADVKSSDLLFDGIAAAGGRPVMWKTGHSPIKAKMQEMGAPLAGEMSAHIFFADRYYGYDDALYAAVRVLNVLAAGGEGLAAFRDALPPVVNTPEVRFPCPEERKAPVIDAVKARLTAEGTDFNGLDGVRVRTAEGWWLLRASNTQDVLVARCEARDEAGLKRLLETVAGHLARNGLEMPGDLLG